MEKFDLIVIGAGPGGYVAAIRASQLGMKVAVVEKDKTLGGTCLNVGCIPSKALLESSELYHQTVHQLETHGITASKVSLNLKKMMERKEGVVKQLTSGIAGLFKKNKITHLKGEAQFTKDKTISVAGSTFSATNYLIATGSVPIELPHLKLDHENLIDSTDALSLNKVPKTLVVIGGGYIGLEMGSVYSRLGSQVTVVEAFERIVPAMDKECSLAFQKILAKQSMEFKLSTKVTASNIKKNGVELTLQNSKNETEKLNAEKVLVCIGRKPFTQNLGLENVGVELDEKGRIKVDKKFQTSTSNIYAVGDVIDGPMLAHKASEEGVACVEGILGQAVHVNYNTIPGVVYTWPEMASVGLTEEMALEKNIEYKKYKFPFLANGRAIALDSTDGFIKLIADKKTDRILGAHLLGPRVSDIIAELVVAMEYQASSEDIARIIHAHPTLTEAVKEAALGLGSGAIHI